MMDPSSHLVFIKFRKEEGNKNNHTQDGQTYNKNYKRHKDVYFQGHSGRSSSLRWLGAEAKGVQFGRVVMESVDIHMNTLF